MSADGLGATGARVVLDGSKELGCGLRGPYAQLGDRGEVAFTPTPALAQALALALAQAPALTLAPNPR